MARRKPNVTPRVRPAEALRAPDPLLVNPAPQQDQQGDDQPPSELALTEAEIVEFPEPEMLTPEVTLGEMMSTTILNNVFQKPVLPENLMSDTPFPGQTPDDSDRALATPLPEPRHETPPTPQAAAPQAPPAAVGGVPLDGHPDGGSHRLGAGNGLVPPPQATPANQRGDAGSVKYIQRITVANAYQFDGRVQTAPDWINRNWLSFDDKAMDETGVGIVLDVPLIGICRRGDYIVQQSVIMDESGYSVDRLAVYPKDDFERIFLPVGQTKAPVAGGVS